MKKKQKVSLFWLLILASFIGLLYYRLFFHFPIWFDEIITKAFLFGLPFIVYIRLTRQQLRHVGMATDRFWPGLLYGLAIGGIFGFLAMFASALKRGHILIPYLFYSPLFWWNFFLAFVTAWWESVFFYGLILGVFQDFYHKNEWKASLLTAVVFLVFHAPNILIHGGFGSALFPLFLLGFFAFGQAVVFLRYKSISSIVVSHAFWGMALLVYTLK